LDLRAAWPLFGSGDHLGDRGRSGVQLVEHGDGVEFDHGGDIERAFAQRRLSSASIAARAKAR
jgi:hypothetical protein